MALALALALALSFMLYAVRTYHHAHAPGEGWKDGSHMLCNTSPPLTMLYHLFSALSHSILIYIPFHYTLFQYNTHYIYTLFILYFIYYMFINET